MTTERERTTEGADPQPPSEHAETLTDLIDRMDRESFRRALEQRDLRLLSGKLRRR
jgi:hypothetical protein